MVMIFLIHARQPQSPTRTGCCGLLVEDTSSIVPILLPMYRDVCAEHLLARRALLCPLTVGIFNSLNNVTLKTLFPAPARCAGVRASRVGQQRYAPGSEQRLAEHWYNWREMSLTR